MGTQKLSKYPQNDELEKARYEKLQGPQKTSL